MVWIINSPIMHKGDAPEVSEQEESKGSAKHRERTQLGHSERSSLTGNGRLSQGKRWPRNSDSGSTTTSSQGSYCSGRLSPETTPKRPSNGRGARFEVGGDYEPMGTIGGELEDLDETNSEGEEQLAELVPLGMRSLSRSMCRTQRRRKTRTNFTDFYKLTDEHLGSGAYASVQTGISISTGKEFAVKLVDKHENGHTRSRIMREVDTFNMCKNHPNIVQLHEWFEDHDFFYMVFEKMRGGPLLNHIQQKGFFTEQEASKVTRDIANALKYLHDRGIAHRDVKPENVLCSDFDHVSPVKLCDLDLASKAAPPSPPKLTSVNSEPDLASPVGSAEFMAPEVVDAFVGDALKYDKRCDMWSLGVIVYIMLCGYPPFYGQCWRENCGWDQGLPCHECQENLFKRIQLGEFDFPESEWDSVSEEAKDLICHLLVKNVRERFTADDVLKHPWIRNGAPQTKLQTPGNLFRNDSARDVHQMQENFNVMNRMVAARLSARLERCDQADDDGTGTTHRKLSVAAVMVTTDSNHNNNDVEKGTPSVLTAKPPNSLVQHTELAEAPVPIVKPTPLVAAMPTPIMPIEAATADSIIAATPIETNTQEMKQNDAVSEGIASPPEGKTDEGNEYRANGFVKIDSDKPVVTRVEASRHMPRAQSETRRTPPRHQHQGFMPLAPQPMPLMPLTPQHLHHMNAAQAQLPVHVSQMAMGQGVAYGGVPVNGPLPFHPNQMINVTTPNALYLYPQQLVAQPIYSPQHFAQQHQMYKMGMVPQPMMAPPAMRNGMLYEQRGSSGYSGGMKKQRCNHRFRETMTPPPGLYPAPQRSSSNHLMAVRSAAALNMQQTNGQQLDQLETCQTAMARQDSKGELRAQARETQVNV